MLFILLKYLLCFHRFCLEFFCFDFYLEMKIETNIIWKFRLEHQIQIVFKTKSETQD